MDGWMDGWIADTSEAHLRPAGTHIQTAKMCHSMQAAEKMGPISSSQIPLRRSYTFKEHLRLYFNPCSLTVCAFGAKKGATTIILLSVSDVSECAKTKNGHHDRSVVM